MRNFGTADLPHHIVQRSVYSPELLARIDAKRREEREAQEAQERTDAYAERERKRKAEAARRKRAQREAWQKLMADTTADQDEAATEADADKPSVKSIIQDVAWERGLEPQDILARSRKQHIVRARQIAMERVRTERPELSLPQIGKFFGGWDHATVLHAIKAVRARRNA